MGTITTRAVPALARGWHWWSSELAQLLPGTLAWSLSRTPRADIRPGRDRVEIVRIAGNEGERLIQTMPLSEFSDVDWQEMATLLVGHRVRLVLARPLAHVITLRLPKAARPYLRTAIPLQLAEHAPLPLERLSWAVVDTRLVGESLVVRIAMAQTPMLDAIDAALDERGIPAPLILAELADGKTMALRKRPGTRIDLSRPWAWAAGILALTPLLAVCLLYAVVVHARATVADLSDMARPKLAAERHIRVEADTARALNQVLGAPPVSNLIETLADHLPPNAHALEMSRRDDGTVEFTVSTKDADAARTAVLGDPHLTGMRASDAVETLDGTTVNFEGQAR